MDEALRSTYVESTLHVLRNTGDVSLGNGKRVNQLQNLILDPEVVIEHKCTRSISCLWHSLICFSSSLDFLWEENSKSICGLMKETCPSVCSFQPPNVTL